MRKIIPIVLCTSGVVLFVFCKKNVDFLTDVGDWKEEEECMEVEGEGRICLEKQIEFITVGDIGDHPLDMIFVLDVSRSMDDDLSRFGRAFRSLISQVENTDWRMFFTTTDHGDHEYSEDSSGQKYYTNQSWKTYYGNEPHFCKFMDLEYNGQVFLNHKQLSKRMVNYEDIFRDTLTPNSGHERCILAPNCQGDMEQPLRVLVACFHQLRQIIRKDAAVAVFIATDEDERVEDFQKATPAEKVIQTFESIFPGQRFYAFAFLIKDEDCYIQQNQYSSVAYGDRVAKLTSLTHGESFSICDADYDDSLRKFSTLLRDKLSQIVLKQKPFLPERLLEVEFISGSSSGGWRVIDQEIIFSEPLSPGTELKVTYYTKKNNILLSEIR